MPRVPTIDNFGVMPNQLPGVSVQPVTPRVDPGQQLGALSRNVERAGAVAMDIDNAELQRKNQVRVDDALNRALEAEMRLTYDPQGGYLSQKGLAAVERQNNRSMWDEYGEAFDKEMESISSTLSNDWQRQQFQSTVAKRGIAFRTSAMRHAVDEDNRYTLSVREGTVANHMDLIGRQYNNLAAVDASIASIEAATYDSAILQGKSAEWAKAQSRKMTSNAIKVAFGTAIEKNDLGTAQEYLSKYSDKMDADDLLQANLLVTKEMDLRVGVEVATEHMGRFAPKLVTSGADRLANVVMGLESGGRRYGPDGKLLEGPDTRFGTAKGEMQVLDMTARNPGLGVAPAKDDSPEERARVGREYLEALTRRYKGDVPKVLAAYNWGFGNLDKAIERGGADWLTQAPPETQKYVEQGAAAFGSGAGEFARPSLFEVKAALRSDPRLANNPARLKAAELDAERQYSDIEKLRKEREEEGTATALRAVLENGGNFGALSPTVRAMIPAKDLDNVMTFADKVRKGEDNTSPWLYNKLASNPGYLASLSDDAFFALRRELSDTDFKHFADERAKALGRTVGSGNSPDDMNTEAIRDVLNPRLQMLGIDPTPTKEAEAARVGAIRRFVDTHIAAAQRAAGKKFSDVEIAQRVDALFAKNATFRGFLSESGPMLSMKIDDMPTEAEKRIREAYKRQGVDDPTDAQILNAYWTARSTQQ